MKRLAPLPLLLGIVSLAGLACGGALSVELMRRGLARSLAADPIAALPDGLHLALCGAGGPLADAERSGPCTAVVAGGTLFVVDTGSDAARNLQRVVGWPPDRVAAVFLSHYHSDHIDGLGELGVLRWAGGSHARPLPVYGPEGLEDVVEGFARAYRHDARFRVAHHGEAVVPASGAGFEARAFAAPPGGVLLPLWDEGGVRVSAVRVDHAPVSPAVGYRFDYAGRSLVVSGDTRRSESLLAAARGVDLLVHEALSPELVGVIHEAAVEAGRHGLAKITADIPDYHTSPVEAAKLAEAAGARHLLFTHVVPPLPLRGLERAFLDGVGDAYDGGVTLGRDGTRVSLPAGSDAIDVER